jgi:hypothetical protein
VAAGILGSYAFTWALTAAGVAALVGLGVPYHDAEMGMIMLAFVVFLGLFLWSFIATRIARVWIVLAGGASLLLTAAWGIQRALLS